MKKLLLSVIFLNTIASFAQDKGTFSAGLESNSQYYTDITSDFSGDDDDESFRSNNYLRLNYDYENWFATVQIESYEPKALLNYYPEYDGTDLGTYAVGYKSQKLEATLGHFYEQFGSGLALRAWEDRQLGINNAIRGGRVKYTPTNYLSLTALYGRQRDGFHVSKGDLYGFNTEVGLTDILNLESTFIDLGFSYVGRSEDLDIEDPNFEALTNIFSTRLNLSRGNFYSAAEYVFKSKDVYIQNNTFFDDKYYTGNAFLLNLGYAKSGLGIDATFRRLENMAIYSERDEYANQYNQALLNYIPALTKQHDYGVTNIYVYQSQPYLRLYEVPSAGEIGGQFDLYYTFKKETALGGKYGTKLAFNFSNWYGLKADYNSAQGTYGTADVLGFGDEFYRDTSLEIRKKFSSNWSSIFTIVNTFYNIKYIEAKANGDEVNTTALVGEATYKMGSGQSLRFEAQHLFSDDETHDREGNWVGGTIEYNINPRITIYANDIYNYGNSTEKTHYYNFGGSFSKGATRISANFGKQRGGLVCVGGVCRYVPENTGFTLNIATAF